MITKNEIDDARQRAHKLRAEAVKKNPLMALGIFILMLLMVGLLTFPSAAHASQLYPLWQKWGSGPTMTCEYANGEVTPATHYGHGWDCPINIRR